MLIDLGMRGALRRAHLGEAAIFFAEALPVEETMAKVLHAAGTSCERDGRSPALVQRVAEAKFEVLDGRQLAVGLRQEIASACRRSALVRLSAPRDLPKPVRRPDRATSSHRSSHLRMTDAILARTDQWSANRRQSPDQDGARRNSCAILRAKYGPLSTQRAFAEWTSTVPPMSAPPSAISLELVEIRVERTDELLLAADLDDLASPAQRVRGSPTTRPDPFLHRRDRHGLLPDEELRKRRQPSGQAQVCAHRRAWPGDLVLPSRGQDAEDNLDPFGPLQSERHDSDEANASPPAGEPIERSTVNE